jgi:hypothetical protein
MFHQYQVTFDENGDVESAVKLPDDSSPKKRVVVVLESTKTKAIKAAERFYPLVKP